MRVTPTAVAILAVTISSCANVILTRIQQSEIEALQQEVRGVRHDLFSHKLYVDQELVRVGLKK